MQKDIWNGSCIYVYMCLWKGNKVTRKRKRTINPSEAKSYHKLAIDQAYHSHVKAPVLHLLGHFSDDRNVGVKFDLRSLI